ncbi:chlorophyll synthase ChlG [Lamprocystis purpurea]|jgi:chlorophyll synthase|uniref:chlorophyll synthase ChlG n=1 Tax=Lamprocystis purpurea TaxID=61598 RepID=UPI00037760F3|nr:chlorophyll synthase ChlG [Lamprocystis purpurea]
MNASAPSLASTGRPSPAAALELLKPITWFPPMWAFACGVVSSGVSFSGHWLYIVAGILLAGPMVCATSQAVNDWFDRHVDAINEPHRPIPSGRIPGRWGLYIAILWTLLSAALAATLGTWVFWSAALGLLLAWAYSAPPVRLKRNGWWSNTAVGFSYEGLAWVTGAAVMLGGDLPEWRILALAALYSLGAHGILTLNDFKAIEGDKQMGLRSLPVQLGVQGAAWAACLFMALPQVLVVWLLVDWGRPLHAAAVAMVVLVQVAMMVRFLRDPINRALWLSAFGVMVYVTGMMISAWALRGLAA